jgi:hypothetical protein
VVELEFVVDVAEMQPAVDVEVASRHHRRAASGGERPDPIVVEHVDPLLVWDRRC